MQINMKKNKLRIKILFLIFVFLNLDITGHTEIMILSGCKNLRDGFIKNEYTLDFEKSIMTRNYIYDSKTFKKYRITDLSVKKENFIERFIYEDKDLILTDKAGYPQFYTQLVFKKNEPIIEIKTVINNEAGISKMSTCSKIEIFKKES
tara:strand:- start:4935 stop:5381 length:447 start_codon:yes stop_codon:yes gene_type:complete